MPRSLRECPGGIVFHVLNRSVAKIPLFRSDFEYRDFLNIIRLAQERVHVELFSYCVMPNHWHFVIRPEKDGDLSQFMQWLTLTHAQRWRHRHNTVGFGPLYQGRFKAFAIQEDDHLQTVVRYVERNPLRANMVKRAEDWQWSSLTSEAANTPEDFPVLADWPIERPDRWLQLVNAPQTTAEEDAFRVSLQKNRPFGSPLWQQRTAKQLNLKSCFRNSGRPHKPKR